MTAPSFDRYVCENDSIEFEREGFLCRATIESDDTQRFPWDDCGHGPVSDWRNGRDKAPGERVLCSDRSSYRFYDFAEAVKIARRDAWGWLPGRLVTKQNSGGRWHAWVGREDGTGECLFNTGGHGDVNLAIRAVYDAHRATMSAKAYAAGAAERDFAVLKAWCDDQWRYVGVVVTAEREGVVLGEASLWGIEANYPDSDNAYLTECALEVAEEAISEAKATLDRLAA